MRFIIQEQAYETLLAAGVLRYFDGDGPTGAVESWRYAAAPDGFAFLRIDLDARAAGGDSYLYHLVLNGAQQPERLTYRFIGRTGRLVSGNVLFDDTSATGSRTVFGTHYDEALPWQPGHPFLIPTTTGLAWVTRTLDGGPTLPALTLNMYEPDDGANLMRLQPLTVWVGESAEAAPQRSHTLAWRAPGPLYEHEIAAPAHGAPPSDAPLHWRRVVTTADGWPVGMERNDGLRARQAQLVRYTT